MTRLDDPHRSRLTAILRAYFEVEHAQRARRLLWQRVGILALLWLLIASAAPGLPRGLVVAGISVVGIVAAGGAVVELRAGKKLSALIDDLP